MLIRLGNRADLPSILEIERQSATAPHWSPADYERIGTGADPIRRELFVAERTGEIVGFAVAACVAALAELETVVVSPLEQNQGIGRALCLAVLAWCRSEGASAAELEVRSGSAAARRLYTNLGFREEGQRPGYYTQPAEDAVLMRVEF